MDNEDTSIELSELLRIHPEGVQVTFTKADGTERQMVCTLNPELIPEDKIPKGERTITSTETLRVFELGLNEWRSFRMDSVVDVLFEIN